MTTGPATFGELLRRHRLSVGLTQEELAERAQVSPRAISDLERGQRNRPWRETVQLLATALNLEPSQRAELQAAARRGGAPSTESAGRLPAEIDVSRRTNLPIQLTSFVGREREIVEVRRRLEATRLLTLTGPGGCGKTRLALQVAADEWEEYPNGVYFVPLAPIDAASSVVPAIAQVVGVKESADQPLIERLGDALRGQKLLLVLDNFEHVLAAAGDIAVLLGACPGIKVLVTSRSPLHLRGEHESPVPPLAVPDRDSLAQRDRALHYEAIRLFVERARAVRPDVAVTDENAATVAEICRRLDGLPLAIELAAARIKTLSAAELLDRLGARLRILTGGARDLPARQQTLRNAIAWSYSLLADEEQRLFRRLGAFVGGFTLESAAVVGSGTRIGDVEAELATLDVLDGLIDKSLIQRQERDADTTRFTMLETIREYAREMLVESGEAAATARAHATYFRSRVVGEGPRQGTAMRVPEPWLERERPNLLAALRWFRDEGGAADGLALVGAVWWLFDVRGPRSEGREWLTTFLELTAGGPRTLDRVSALFAAGLSAINLGEPATARAGLDEGLSIARELGDQQAEVEIREALGMMETELGNLAAARRQLDAALSLQRPLANRNTLTAVLIHCGSLAAAEGDDARARSFYEESLAVGAYPEWSRRFLGYVALHGGDVSAARAYVLDSLELYRGQALSVGLVECLNALGGLALVQKNWTKAARLLGAVAVLHRTLIGGSFYGMDRMENERFLAATRAALAEEEFSNAWAEGSVMTLEQAIGYALEEGD
jgi:non-specific serine/threonine protein kinase